MSRSVRKPRRQAGFTLVELMVSLVMFSFAVAGILAVAVAMARGFREQRTTIGAEGASRAAMDFIGDAVRGAAPGVTTGNVQALYDAACTGTPAGNSFFVTNSTTGPDELTVVFASGAISTSLATAFSGGTSMSVTSGTDLANGDMVLVSDFNQGHLAKIQSGGGTGSLTLGTQACGTPTFPAGGAYKQGSIVVRALRAKFFVLAIDTVPTLWMDPDAEGPDLPEPLAEGIEDFQIAIAIDGNGDNIISDDLGATANGDEWIGNNAGDTWPLPPYAIRAVRITLVAREVGETTATSATYYRPAALDHSVATTPDKWRRRVLTSTIEVRNLVGSP